MTGFLNQNGCRSESEQQTAEENVEIKIKATKPRILSTSQGFIEQRRQKQIREESDMFVLLLCALQKNNTMAPPSRHATPRLTDRQDSLAVTGTDRSRHQTHL